MRDIVILALSAYFLIVALRSRYIGLIAYWWFGIFRPHDWTWGDISGYRLPLLAAIVLVIPSLLQGLYPSVKSKTAKTFLLFLFLALLARLYTSCEPLGYFRQQQLLQFSILIFIVLLTVTITDSKRRFIGIIAIVGLSLAFHSGKAGLQGIIGTGGTYYGASTMTGLFTGSNGFAFGSAVLLFFNLYLYRMNANGLLKKYLPARFNRVFKPNIIKIIMLLLCIGIFYNVITLSSRGSFLAMCGGLVLWLLLSNLIKLKNILIAVPLMIGLATITPLPEGFTDRITSAFVDEEQGEVLDHSAASRPHFWNVAFVMAKDNLTGVGPGCYNTYYPLYDTTNGFYGRYRTVHSSHFQVLSEVGFLGAAIWILLFVTSLLKLLRIRKDSIQKSLEQSEQLFFKYGADMLITAQIVFFVGGIFYAQAYNDLIWLIWGLTLVLHSLLQKSITDLNNKKASPQ